MRKRNSQGLTFNTARLYSCSACRPAWHVVPALLAFKGSSVSTKMVLMHGIGIMRETLNKAIAS